MPKGPKSLMPQLWIQLWTELWADLQIQAHLAQAAAAGKPLIMAELNRKRLNWPAMWCCTWCTT